MINEGFKKQLIVNAYKTQLLPVTKDNTVNNNSIETIKGIKNLLLFKSNVGRPLDYKYKYKYETIDDDIHWFLTYLISAIYLIYDYNYYQENILYNTKKILKYKHNIEKSLKYVEYLEDIYDK